MSIRCKIGWHKTSWIMFTFAMFKHCDRCGKQWW